MSNIVLPASLKIIQKLKNAGHEAYWAGGCVRDMLLGIKPKDFDIVTSATPDEIEKILKKTFPVGKNFGIIMAIENGHHFEVATFRSDSGYSDGRRPDYVTFANAKEDALRRDFTINGMFFDPFTEEIIDYVAGQKDLDAGLVRFIGNPHQRILEDHLRILRAIRFKNQLNFQYEPKTYEALSTHATLVIDKVSKERVFDEMNKILLTAHAAEAFNDMEDLGIIKILFPQLQKMKGLAQPKEYHHEGDVWTHSMDALRTLPSTTSLAVRWATLLHDVGKTETFLLKERIRFDHHANFSKKLSEQILTGLHAPRKFIDEVGWLVEHHMMMVELLKMPEGKKLKWFLHPWFLNLMEVFKADAAGTTPSDLSLYDEIRKTYRESVKKIPYIPKPLLTGKEIMEILKIKPGKKVGDLLEELHERQLSGLIENKNEAIVWINKKGEKNT